MLRVFRGEREKVFVGETEFDLAKYGKSFQITEKLPLSGDDPDAYIEVLVKTSPLDAAPSTPGFNHSS